MSYSVRELRVAAVLDASGYDAGKIASANEKIAQTTEIARKALELEGFSVEQIDRKMAVAVNSLERYNKTSIDGYSSAVKLEGAFRAYNRALELGLPVIGQATAALQTLVSESGVSSEQLHQLMGEYQTLSGALETAGASLASFTHQQALANGITEAAFSERVSAQSRSIQATLEMERAMWEEELRAPIRAAEAKARARAAEEQSLRGLVSAYNPLHAEITKLREAEALLTSEVSKGGAQQQVYERTLQNVQQRMRVVQDMEITGTSKMRAYAMQNLSYQANDIVSGFAMGQNPTQILAQQGGQVIQAFQMMEIPIGRILLTAGALAALAVPLYLVASRVYELEKRAKAFAAASEAYGGNFSSTRAEDTARKIAETGTFSRSDVYAGVTSLGAVPNVSLSARLQAAQVASPLATATGKDFATALKELTDALPQGSAGLEKLNNQYRFLSVDQEAYIRGLIRAGESSKAWQTALSLLQAQMQKAVDVSKGPLTEAFKSLSNSWNDLLDVAAKSDLVQSSLKGLASGLQDLVKLLKEGISADRGTIDRSLRASGAIGTPARASESDALMARLRASGAIGTPVTTATVGAVPEVIGPPIPSMPVQPLGVRINNPWDIREAGIGWNGSTGQERGFTSFGSMDEGLRAGFINTLSKFDRGVTSITDLVTMLSPPSENNTGKMISEISAELKTSASEPLNLKDPSVLAAFGQAVLRQEGTLSGVSGEAIKRVASEVLTERNQRSIAEDDQLAARRLREKTEQSVGVESQFGFAKTAAQAELDLIRAREAGKGNETALAEKENTLTLARIQATASVAGQLDSAKKSSDVNLAVAKAYETGLSPAESLRARLSAMNEALLSGADASVVLSGKLEDLRKSATDFLAAQGLAHAQWAAGAGLRQAEVTAAGVSPGALREQQALGQVVQSFQEAISKAQAANDNGLVQALKSQQAVRMSDAKQNLSFTVQENLVVQLEALRRTIANEQAARAAQLKVMQGGMSASSMAGQAAARSLSESYAANVGGTAADTEAARATEKSLEDMTAARAKAKAEEQAEMSVLQKLKGNRGEEQAELEALSKLYDKGLISLREFNKAQNGVWAEMLEKSEDWADGVESAMRKFISTTKSAGQIGAEVTSGWLNGIGDVVSNSLSNGKWWENIKSLGLSVSSKEISSSISSLLGEGLSSILGDDVGGLSKLLGTSSKNNTTARGSAATNPLYVSVVGSGTGSVSSLLSTASGKESSGSTSGIFGTVLSWLGLGSGSTGTSGTSILGGSALNPMYVSVVDSGTASDLGSSISDLFSSSSSSSSSSGGIFDSILSLFGFATGGYINGSGSGTSDSNLAFVSNGEYIVNANSTAKNRKLLDAINTNRVLGYADGGLVSDSGSTGQIVPATIAYRSGDSDKNSNSGANGVTTIQVHQHFPVGTSVESFRKSQAQVASMAYAAMSSASKRRS